MMSSIRFRNSGRKWARRASRIRFSISASDRSGSSTAWLPRLLVMMMTVFVKSTVRPWPSVRRPSSSTWSRALNTSGCAFSTSSKQDDRVRAATHGFGQLATLVVADVAGRRADQRETRHGAPGTRTCRSGRWPPRRRRGTRPARARSRSCPRRSDRRTGRSPAGGCPSVRPARLRRMASDTASSAWSCPTTRVARRSSMWSETLAFGLEHLRDRDAGPPRDDLGDVLFVHLFLEQAAVAVAGELLLLGLRFGLELRGSPRSAGARPPRGRPGARAAPAARWPPPAAP